MPLSFRLSGKGKPRHVEAVEPAAFGPHRRQRAYVARRRDGVGEAGQLGSFNRQALQALVTGEQGRDAGRALLFLQRAHRIDQRPAGLQQVEGVDQQAVLGEGEAADILLVLQPGDVGMAAQRAGAGARGVEQDGIEAAALADRLAAVDAYVAPVALTAEQRIIPGNLRERIRSSGPTVALPGASC
jgi:hypothetical protein